MADLSDEACAERLLTALDLADTGIQLRLAQLRRKFPEESDVEIRHRLNDWLLHPDGAEHGDAPGRFVDPSTIA